MGLPAMLEAIAQARDEILLEMYWFGSDRTGRMFAEALSARARDGVRVCVTYDAVGSWEADRSMFQHMRAAGCLVHEYNPPAQFFIRLQLQRMHRRNHRKMLIVDGRVGFTGGVNLGDLWAPGDDGTPAFRDDMIRIEGPAVSHMRHIFLGTFRRGTEGVDVLIDDEYAHQRGARVSRGVDPRVLVVTNEGRRFRRAIERSYLIRIREAQHSIIITNSYFIPRPAVRRALSAAANRGVRVQLLVPLLGDVPAVTYAGRWLYDWFLRHGIEVYRWTQSMLHSKTAVIDDRWCTVGTHNFDHRSLFYNLEVNALIEDEDVATHMAHRMREDLAKSQRVELRGWRYRPLAERLLELLFFRLRRLL